MSSAWPPARSVIKRLIDDLALAEDHPADALAHLRQALAQGVDLRDQIGHAGGGRQVFGNTHEVGSLLQRLLLHMGEDHDG